MVWQSYVLNVILLMANLIIVYFFVELLFFSPVAHRKDHY